MTDVNSEQDNGMLYFECPHCTLLIQVHQRELNCRIFRHGTFRATGLQIPPHLSKQHCEALTNTNQIYGCGKPFRIVALQSPLLAATTTGTQQQQYVYSIEQCDYI